MFFGRVLLEHREAGKLDDPIPKRLALPAPLTAFMMSPPKNGVAAIDRQLAPPPSTDVGAARTQMPPYPSKKSLLLLGGPPGVGKTTVLRILAKTVSGCTTVDADDVWSPATFAQREQDGKVGITKITEAVGAQFDAGSRRVVLAWVFAREETYQPFLHHFTGAVDQIRVLYLVASPDVVARRLAGRGDPENAPYALSRLELIRRLPFKKIDTTLFPPDWAAAAIKDELQWPTVSGR